MILPRCTPKQLTWILIFFSVSVFLHIWYLSRMSGFVSDVSRFLIEARSKFLEDFGEYPPPHSKHVLFWNGYSNLKDRDIQCKADGGNCIYKVRYNANATNVNDVFIFAVLFNELNFNLSDTPKDRWPDDLYIFWCMEPSFTSPACEPHNKSFFNWTFTYRLDSTVVWNNFVVQDRNTSEVVAPSKTVIWNINHDPLRHYVKMVIGKKTKTIAWITSDCKMNHKGSSIMYELQEQLTLLGLFVDVYGPCSKKCSNDDCDKMIKNDYHFYIAFEDYVTTDYVSNKVLRAYDNYAVPVVYGGANYNWFLPQGSYLNAVEMHPYSLAQIIKQAVSNVEFYESFFKWTNVYEINAYPEGRHPLCNLCAALNNKTYYSIKE